MKRELALALAAFLISSAASADCTSGYFRKDGTYVQGYCRSAPNANRYDNYGSQTMGGSQRDEFSSRPAYNRSSPGYGYGDNDGDGLNNGYDPKPNNRCNNPYGCY